MEQLVTQFKHMNQNKISLLQQKDEGKIGWISIYTPEEIIDAAGLIPYRITGDNGSNHTDASVLLSNNYCSYVLSCLSEGISGIHQVAQGILFVDACDMRKRLYEAWVNQLQPEYSLLLELPRDINTLSREYFIQQLHRLKESLEAYTGKEITNDDLRQSISKMNEKRGLLQKMYALRKGTSQISGKHAIEIVKASTCGLTDMFNEHMSEYLEAIESHKGKSRKKHRVMLCGSYFDCDDIVDVIEETGAIIACEDISNGIKYAEGQIQINAQEDPIEALADYYLSKTTCARMLNINKRFDHMKALIEEYEIDSIIYFTLKFCDTNLLDFPFMKQKIDQLGIPVIFIEGEHHITNIQSIKTRIQTFLETIMY